MVEKSDRKPKLLEQFAEIAKVRESHGKIGEEEFFNEMTNVLQSLKDLKTADKKDEPVDMEQVKKILAGESEPNLYSFQSTLAGEEKKEANVVPFLSGHDLEGLRKSVQEQFNLK